MILVRLIHKAEVFLDNEDVIIAALEALQGVADGTHVIVPKEPTEAMIKASNKALSVLINSIPPEERLARFGEPTERGYKISGAEKAAIRYRAMIGVEP